MKQWQLKKRFTGEKRIVERDSLSVAGPWLVFGNGREYEVKTDQLWLNSQDYIEIELLESNPEPDPKRSGGMLFKADGTYRAQNQEPLGAPIETDLSDEKDVPLPGMEPIEGFHFPFSDEDQELMNKYHLDDLHDEDTGALLGFICTGIKGMREPCGMRYPSIGDRMKREPESCSGCFVRMANG